MVSAAQLPLLRLGTLAEQGWVRMRTHGTLCLKYPSRLSGREGAAALRLFDVHEKK